MIKFAILGCENSHANNFLNIIKDNPEYSDFSCVGVYSNEREAAEKLGEHFGVHVADSYDEFVGKVDAIVVTARHGDWHHTFAMPYVNAGIPMFIDKPFTIKRQLADELINGCKANCVPVCGGSSLRFLNEFKSFNEFVSGKTVQGGWVSAPVSMDNPHGGFAFYCHHLIEMLLTGFGTEVRSVYAKCNDTSKNNVTVIFSYDNFEVAGHYYGNYHYAAGVFTDNGNYSFDTEDLGGIFEAEFAEFAQMCRTRKMPADYDRILLPVKIACAIEQSYTENREVTIL